MPDRRLAAFTLLFAASIIAWALTVSPALTLPVWGNTPSGIALLVFGSIVTAAGLAYPNFARWFPRPVPAGFVIGCFGVSMIAGSGLGLWILSPAAALGAVSFAVSGYGQGYPLLPPADDAPPTLHERIRFWFACALPWVAVYEFTVHMRLAGTAFQFPFEDNLPIYPSTSLIYQSTYAAVTAAPFFARTRRDLRELTVSAWVATALVFPFYWAIPSTAPRRPMSGDGVLARLLSFERNTYPPSAAFPSFHVLWSIFIGRLIRPAWIGWLYALAVAVSCITTGMHYIPDVLVSFLIAPLFIDPRRLLWNPLPRLTGLSEETLAWSLVYALLGLVTVCVGWRTGAADLTTGVLLIGIVLIEFARAGRAQRGPNRR